MGDVIEWAIFKHVAPPSEPELSGVLAVAFIDDFPVRLIKLVVRYANQSRPGFSDPPPRKNRVESGFSALSAIIR